MSEEGTILEKKPILIVDDEYNIREVLTGILKIHGYAPVAVPDGESALKQAQAETPCAILMDLQLPDMNGLDVIREIQDRSGDIPCIVITGHGSEASAIEAINMGIYSYIQKPFDTQQLLLTISRALEKQEAQKSLHRKNAEMNSFINNLPDMAWLTDINSRFIVINKAFCKTLGMDSKFLINNTCEVCFSKEAAEKSLADDRKVMESKSQLIIEEKIVDSQDNEMWLETIKSPILDESGKVTGTVGISRDITNRVSAEMEIQKARQTAEAANRAKSEFLANMSHELRTPLNHIIGFTELVVDKHFGDLSETQEEYLGDVLHSSRHLLDLINDILDLSRVEAGKLKLELSDVDVKALLENSLVMFTEKAMLNKMQLSTDMTDIPGTITTDERKLRQIIYNLLSNAVKFSHRGGEISIGAGLVQGFIFSDHFAKQESLDESTPDFTGKQAENFMEIYVKDFGIGILKKDLKRLFDPFEQVENSKSRKYHGTGLGLSLTKNLVEFLGGKIWAESDGEGKGSTFRFVIPV